LNRLAEMAAELAALLAPGLEDDLIGLDGIDDLAAFADGVRQWLLAVDVLLRLRRHDARDRMPMVRRRDDDGIDVLAVQELGEVFVRLAPLVVPLLVLAVALLDRLLPVLPPLA